MKKFVKHLAVLLSLLLAFVVGMLAFAGTKHDGGGDGGTNNVPRGAVVELDSRGDAESQRRGTPEATRLPNSEKVDLNLCVSASLRETISPQSIRSALPSTMPS